MPSSNKKSAVPNPRQPAFGKIRTPQELGEIIRLYRKNQRLTLEKISGLTYLGMRFISEVERGKETAEIGKVLTLINRLGLEIIIQPRGYQYKLMPPMQPTDPIDE